MDSLKSCPFCGGEAYCYYDSHSDKYYVKCFDCSANVMIHNPTSCCNKYTMNDVISKWNKRVINEGYWVEDSDGDSVSCSECGFKLGRFDFNVGYKYCPECGARMNNV